MRVVIADDSRAMRMIVKRTLKQAGYPNFEIVEAPDGYEAALKVREAPPHLVLTDWNMPKWGGKELLEWLQKAGFSGVVGVVTSAATPEMRTTAKTLGATFVLCKPFTPESFRHALSSAGFPAEGGAATSAPSGLEATTRATLDKITVQSMLKGAFRRELIASEVGASPPANFGRCMVARYGAGDSAVAGFVVAEIEVALGLGAALTLIPAGVVKDCARSNSIPDNLHGNMNEVFNLLTRAVATTDGALMVGMEKYDSLPADLASASGSAKQRLDLELEVAGYPKGKIMLIRAA